MTTPEGVGGRSVICDVVVCRRVACVDYHYVNVYILEILTTAFVFDLNVWFPFPPSMYCAYSCVIQLHDLDHTTRIQPTTIYRLFNPQNRDVGKKLLFTTGLMFTLPILTYFIVSYIIHSNPHYKQTITNPDNYAGGAAILMTNIIIGGYCYMAYYEDNNEIVEPPRVGKFKERTD